VDSAILLISCPDQKGIVKEIASFIADNGAMDYSLHFSDQLQKVAIFVSKQEHCFYDLMQRFQRGELRGDVKLVISNHEDMKPLADFFGVPYYHIPKSRDALRKRKS